MVQVKSFVTTDSNEITNSEFQVKNGLQQGTVNSPILFNIYKSDILRHFDFNTNNNKSAIAFDDDLIIYIKLKKATIIQEQFEKAFHEVLFYCDSWKLKINTGKCETILFRPRQIVQSIPRKLTTF
ncbi:hypothetical protein M0804_014886 [Polistes exclamans]|nr:hypothetical protein M0804_014886 [Polistes exclamans]